jgi:hypothetical protein
MQALVFFFFVGGEGGKLCISLITELLFSIISIWREVSGSWSLTFYASIAKL